MTFCESTIRTQAFKKEKHFIRKSNSTQQLCIVAHRQQIAHIAINWIKNHSPDLTAVRGTTSSPAISSCRTVQNLVKDCHDSLQKLHISFCRALLSILWSWRKRAENMAPATWTTAFLPSYVNFAGPPISKAVVC